MSHRNVLLNGCEVHVIKHCSLIIILSLLSACQSLSFFGETEKKIDPNLIATLQPALLQIKSATDNKVSLKTVIDSYSQLLPLLKEPETQLKVLQRLADLKLQKGELLMADQAVDELDVAISAYTGLLSKYPDRKENDQVLYQLSKTYDLKGMRVEQMATLNRLIEQYPNSKYYVEVQFRRGEILFTQGDYLAAKSAFGAVIKAGKSAFQANAYYMEGWSLFKSQRYESALVSYTHVLDLLLPVGSNKELSAPEVEKKHQTIIEDLLRVMGLSFSYLDGVNSLDKLFSKVGTKHYEILVYDRYSQQLLKKQQYTDVIAIYKRFIERHPMSLWAPHYQIHIMETLKVAGFRSAIGDEKVRFVQTYGKGSDYWQNHIQDELVFSKSQLEVLLPELADLHYVKAQTADKKKANNQRSIEYKKAAYYNRAFVETFPKHEQTAKRYFLLAESEAQLQNWLAAIDAFEQAGYQFKDFDSAAEAAYASVLVYKDYVTSLHSQLGMNKRPGKKEQFEKQKQFDALIVKQQKSRLRFVAHYPEDKRALGVLYIATRFNYQQKEYALAIKHAQQIIDWPKIAGTDKTTLLEAQLIKAHSLYASQDYILAEPAYQAALKYLPKKDKRRLALIENLAACVFKQAEQLLADGKKQLAIDELLRVGQVAPSSTLRANAEYDAGNYLLELKQWPKMIEVLTDFRKRYPQHKLQNTLPAKLALAYRETKQWQLAAAELKLMYAQAKDPQKKQDTLYIIAELYDKAENAKQAILSYRLYANTYPKPANSYMEAANRLAQLYHQTEQPLKRRFWLAKQIKAVDKAPKKVDDRMRYLAASASSVLANDAFQQYKRIKLSLPLNKTMLKKTKALKKAMQAFQKTAAYGVSQFSTEAGFRMADIYAQLSVDLMASDRPKGLNELELEQYDILLEEQAFPFEDSAINIHEQNASRSWAGIYDKWVKNSFQSLRTLLPGRYAKDELMQEAVNELK